VLSFQLNDNLLINSFINLFISNIFITHLQGNYSDAFLTPAQLNRLFFTLETITREL